MAKRRSDNPCAILVLGLLSIAFFGAVVAYFADTRPILKLPPELQRHYGREGFKARFVPPQGIEASHIVVVVPAELADKTRRLEVGIYALTRYKELAEQQTLVTACHVWVKDEPDTSPVVVSDALVATLRQAKEQTPQLQRMLRVRGLRRPMIRVVGLSFTGVEIEATASARSFDQAQQLAKQGLEALTSRNTPYVALVKFTVTARDGQAATLVGGRDAPPPPPPPHPPKGHTAPWGRRQAWGRRHPSDAGALAQAPWRGGRAREGSESVTGTGLSEPEAKRFYDRYGRRLDWSDAFEGRAKTRAHSLVEAQPGDRVLEVGIGCGHFLSLAQERVGPEGLAVGIDLSETMVALGRRRSPGSAILRTSALDMPFASATFAWAFSSYVLDLMPEWSIARTLAETHRVLAPGGRLVLCSLTEGRTLLESAFMGMWKRIQRVSPASVGGCRPLVLAPFLAAAGFEVESAEHVGQLGTPSEVLLARRGPRL